MSWNLIWGQAICPPFFPYMMHPKSTVRFSTRSPLSGEKMRLRFSNIYGKQPYVIGECTARSGGVRVQVTIDGSHQLVIPCGGATYSDEVNLKVASGEDVEVSICCLNRPGEGNMTEDTANLVKRANLTQAELYPSIKRSNLELSLNFYPYVPLLDSIEVLSANDPAVVVAFGDSITQQSTWTKPLSARLFDEYRDQVVLVNKGIGGNRIRFPGKGITRALGEAAVDRMDRDVLSLHGVKTVIIALGTNDIGQVKKGKKEYTTSDQIAEALQGMVGRLKERGIKAVGTTLLPRMGSMGYKDYHEVTRREVNGWIRSYSGFDCVIDFEKVTEDPAKPGWMVRAYHNGDYLHPNKVGGRVMAEAIDLEMLV